MEYLKAFHEAVTTWLGDWASVAGVLFVLIGFFITILNVKRSKSAAQQTKKTVEKIREDSIRIDLVSDCSTMINLMDHIKYLHRKKEWALLPDKYTALRKVLISVKTFDAELTDDQSSTIQGAGQIFRGLEKQVEKALQTGTDKLDVAKQNTIISGQVDSLQEVLISVKEKIGR